MRLFRILVALPLLGAFVWGLLALAVYLFSLRDEARAADAIIVLGAAQYDGKPSPVLRARLDHAIELHNAGMAPMLIVTGGVGVGDTVSEAEVSQRYARKAGIPEGKILVEKAGLSTDESMRTVAAMMERRGLQSAVLVSDPFHMLRLRILAARVGIRGYSSPTRTSPIAGGSAAEWKHVVRESIILPVLLVRDI